MGNIIELKRRRKIIMKRFLISLLFMFFIVSLGFAGEVETVVERDIISENVGWNVYASDDDMDTAGGLVTELDTTFAQLAAEDQIEVVSSSASDTTQTVTVAGIDNSGNRISEDFTVTGTTVVLSSATFRYIDQVSVDIECAGTITVQRETNTFIISIPVGQLDAQVSQHFNGENVSYITGWRASVTSTTGTVLYELRFYPDDADCLDSADGYQVLDAIQFTNALGTDSGAIGNPIKCSAGGWIVIWQTSGTDNADGNITIQGYDVKY